MAHMIENNETVMHLRRDLVVENFHMRRLCDGKWEPWGNILADSNYPVARPLCAACRSIRCDPADFGDV